MEDLGTEELRILIPSNPDNVANSWQLSEKNSFLKFTIKISPVRDDSFQAGGGVHSTEPLLEMIDLQS